MPTPNSQSSNANNTYYQHANTQKNRTFPTEQDMEAPPPLHELSFTALLNRCILQYWQRNKKAFVFIVYSFLHYNWLKITIISIVAAFLMNKISFSTATSGEDSVSPKIASHKTLLGSDLNPFAPVSAAHLNERQAQAYIKRFLPTAIAEMEHFGIPASIQIAQGLVESRAGNSKLAQANNNHFGLKCFSKTCPKGHCSNFTDDHHKDFFKKFPSAWDSWREHSKLLSNDYYKPLHQVGRDYKKWAAGLQSLGYATDPHYEAKIIGMVEKYRLYEYDSR